MIEAVTKRPASEKLPGLLVLHKEIIIVMKFKEVIIVRTKLET